MFTKRHKREFFDAYAPERRRWIRKNHYYHAYLADLMRFLIPQGARVLDIGCGTGDLLAELGPERGLGVDFSPPMLDQARRVHGERENLEFRQADAEALELDETFDYVVMSDLIGDLTDVWAAFRGLQAVTHDHSKVVVTFYNDLWEPILRLAERLGLKKPMGEQNWMALADVKNLLELNGFETIRQGYKLILPVHIPWVSPFVNRFIGNLPLIDKLGLITYTVAQRKPECVPEPGRHSVTVLIPCRNEKGNIRDAVARTPEMGRHTEILFVDGNSTDGTVEEIEQVIAENRGKRDIRLLHQTPRGHADGQDHGRMLALGKGDAVRKGFAAAAGEILMILDADLTVPPEELPRFVTAIEEGRGQFINGTRLVYPMEEQAMRTLNKIANKLFAALFTWLLGQPIRDTLCGTKVLLASDYQKIADNRHYFGDFDPFGDFDLLFGAAKQNLKIVDIPIHYAERTYGDIKIERFKHGLILLRMCLFAMGKLRFR